QLQRDKRVDTAGAYGERAARHEPDEERGGAPEPDVHSSSSEARPGTRSCTTAPPVSGSTSTTRRLGASDGTRAANARRPASTARSPPTGNSSVRNAPGRGRKRAASTRKNSGTTRSSGLLVCRSQLPSTRNPRRPSARTLSA